MKRYQLHVDDQDTPESESNDPDELFEQILFAKSKWKHAKVIDMEQNGLCIYELVCE